MENTMFELADRLKGLRDKKDALAEQTKANNAEIEETERALAALMIESETQSFNRAGLLFYLNTKMYASANAERKTDLFDSLKAEGFGDLITETINANSLAAFVREQMENNEDELPDWLNGKVNVFEKTAVGLRKSK